MWKESDEYEAAAPAVQAHFHALRTEDALRRDDFAAAEREGRLASDKFAQAAERVASKRTADALLLLAQNYEYRAKVARARLPAVAMVEQQQRGVNRNRDTQLRPSGERPVQDSAARSDNDTADLADAGTTESVKSSLPHAATRSLAVDSSGAGIHDPAASVAAETQLNLAAAEMEELWRRLHEIGLSSAGSFDKNNVLMASRHLSSSLGDSFCLLPAKSKSAVGVHGTAIDGGSTLRAAVASRMRNQRLRLMEQQFGSRGIIDDRFHKPQVRASSVGGSSANGGYDPANRAPGGHSDHLSALDRRSSLSNSNSGAGASMLQPDASEVDGLHETIAQQKLEIVRLLNTVKSLSSENTTLLKKCETLTNVQAENQEIHESMEKFKVHYNQKLVMIKRALEEWRRQRNSSVTTTTTSSAPPPPPAASDLRRTAELEQKLALQTQQLAQLTDAVKSKDEQLAKYEKWYRTLKAGAKAKQRGQATAGSVGLSSSGSGPMDTYGIGGALPKDSFTNSSSFHDYSNTSAANLRSSSSASSGLDGDAVSGRPPAHPTRRAL